jgi:UDP-N-acetylmuramoyl-tripeptide--D-alanyl-D-alanine ligase
MHGMSPLWTSEELALALGGEASTEFVCEGVAFDSREIGPGDLFFALKGEQADGHRFVEGAFANGASGAIVSEAVAGPHIRLADTMRALEQLGIASRDRVDATIIGVTGSAGKTGTKEALYAALDRASFGKAHRSVKSYNNHVGVPLSLSRMPADTRYGVFEMGMNHAGELSALTQFVRPHIAIITTIAPAHIEHFRNEEAIADAKGEIFEGLVAGGTAIIPRDNAHYERLRAKAELHAANIVTFGFSPDADVRCVDHVAASGGGSLITAKLSGGMLCYTLSQPGDHWIANSLAVLAAVEAAGADWAG